jgi:hypothetical protein
MKPELPWAVLIALAAVFAARFAWAAESSSAARKEKSRDDQIKELILNLHSENLNTAANAADALGRLGATEAVPELLIVLQSPKTLLRGDHIVEGSGDARRGKWVRTSVKEKAVEALGAIGDRRAVPLLERYLKDPPPSFDVLPENVAYALSRITGKKYDYKRASSSDAQKDPPMESPKIITNLQAFEALEAFVTEQSRAEPKPWSGVLDRVKGIRQWLTKNPQTAGFGPIEFKGTLDSLRYAAETPLQESIRSQIKNMPEFDIVVYGDVDKLPLKADVWVMHFGNALTGGYNADIDAHTGQILDIVREIEG